MQHERISGYQSTLKNQLYLKEMTLRQAHKKRRISNLRFEKQVNRQMANFSAFSRKKYQEQTWASEMKGD